MDIEKISDGELALALRCCVADSDTSCVDCPAAMYGHFNCFDAIRTEAARRLDGISSIKAARDAMAKELKKRGVKI